jgi:hypothetical protein
MASGEGGQGIGQGQLAVVEPEETVEFRVLCAMVRKTDLKGELRLTNRRLSFTEAGSGKTLGVPREKLDAELGHVVTTVKVKTPDAVPNEVRTVVKVQYMAGGTLKAMKLTFAEKDLGPVEAMFDSLFRLLRRVALGAVTDLGEGVDGVPIKMSEEVMEANRVRERKEQRLRQQQLQRQEQLKECKAHILATNADLFNLFQELVSVCKLLV